MATLYRDLYLVRTPVSMIRKTIGNIDVYQIGAGGRTRTDTTFYGPRILSPVRLPFRHTGYIYLQPLTHELTDGT
jgi:hypothetical protein